MAKRHYIPITADVPGVNEGQRAFIRKVIRTALAAEGVDFPCEVDVLLTNDEAIHQINLDMREVDRATDVLSFPEFDLQPGELPGEEDADPGTGLVPLGDMVISMEHVAAQAKEYGHSNRRELAYLVVHSVLHLLGCAALLTCLLHPALEKLPPLAGVTGSAVLFALLNQLPQGWLGFEGTHLAALPAAWYKPNLFWLGLPDLTVFSSSDYFPLLPWVFLYWVGYFFARWFRARCTAQPGLPPKALRPLCAVGSRTLLIYMLHQPVIYGALLGLRYLGFV